MLKRPELADLVHALHSANDAERESAVARLTLLGDLATRKVAAVVRDPTAPPLARAAGLRVLSAANGSLPIEAAAAALASSVPAVVEQACDLLGRRAGESGAGAARALDELTGLALSTKAPTENRLSAIAALEGLPDALMRPVFEALAKDTSSRIVSRAARARAGHAWTLETLMERGLTDDPALVAAAARDDAAETTVTELRRVIDAVRRRERDADVGQRGHWQAIRGTLHEALAARGSRIALYDLRETFETSRGPVPIGFLAAAAAVGDAATLDSIAAAWESASPSDRWYRDHLTDVFGAIVQREGITRDHASLKKLLTRRPGTAALVALAPKTRRARR